MIRERLNKITNDNTKRCQQIKSDLELVENEVERAKKHEKVYLIREKIRITIRMNLRQKLKKSITSHINRNLLKC